jgi:hypothetical protein
LPASGNIPVFADYKGDANYLGSNSSSIDLFK